MNKTADVISAILTELNRAEKLWPRWPGDPIHQAAIVSEEAGELVRAANLFVYGEGTEEEMRTEAIQVGAMAIRFLKYASAVPMIKRTSDVLKNENQI